METLVSKNIVASCEEGIGETLVVANSLNYALINNEDGITNACYASVGGLWVSTKLLITRGTNHLNAFAMKAKKPANVTFVD